MSNAKLVILENTLGQKVRTFAITSDTLNLVYLKDKRRIEACAQLQDLDDNGVEYSLVKKLKLSQITADGIELQGLGRIRLFPTEGAAKNSPTYVLPEQKDEETLKLYMKNTAIGHVAAVFLLVVASWISAHYFTKAQEPVLVTIELPQEKKQEIVKAPPRQTVKVSEKKLKPTMKVVKKVVKTQTLVKRTAKAIAPTKDVRRIGCLGSLKAV